MGLPLAVGVLASGEGTTFEGLATRAEARPGSFQITVVISDRPQAPVLGRAERRGIPAAVVSRKGLEVDAWGARITEELARRRVDLVVLAGFLGILPPTWVERWKGRAVNLHPSLLPRYGGRGMHGRHVHEAVLASGDRETGATVHLVTNDVDGGPTVAQRRLAVLPGDTPESLRERLRPVEIALLAETIENFAAGSLPLPYPERELRDPVDRDDRRRAG